MQISDHIFQFVKPVESAPGGKVGQAFPVYKDGRLLLIYVGVNDPLQIYDLAAATQKAEQLIDKASIGNYVFSLEENGLSPEEQTIACIGWCLGCYRFTAFKSEKAPEPPLLLCPEGADRERME